MQYEKSVPSMGLCEEMARLGICQDWAELWWLKHPINDTWDLFTGNPLQEHKVIAPTLARMMEELPTGVDVLRDTDGLWYVSKEIPFEYEASSWNVYAEDKHLPNAVAKALIAIKKGEV